MNQTNDLRDRKCKTISFDLGDEIELDLLRYAESKGMFSRYVKRLIQKDKLRLSEMRRGEEIEVYGEDEHIDDLETETKMTDEDIIEGFI